MSEYDFDEDNLSGGDYDYDHSYRDERESDEDTADASETDMVKQEEEYTEIKEQMYQDKLANLKKQLQQLQEGVHPEYLKRLKKLEQAYQDRLLLNEVFQSYEIERVEKEYINEKKAAVRDFEEKKIELRENLIAELEEKKRLIESERSTMELTGDSMEVKPVTTRKLRRRPNEPLPIPEKRRRTSPAQLNLLLDENDILDDLKVLNKYSERDAAINLQGKVPKKEASEGVVTSETFSSSVEAKIEDGKLYYDKRWFHRGQPIFFESKETGKCSGVISTIGTNEVWVKKTVDTSKVRIQLAHLQKGKFTIRRRSS